MGLSKIQQTIWQKSRATGAGQQGVGLNDGACGYLVARIVHDLSLGGHFPTLPPTVPELFTSGDLDALTLKGDESIRLFEKLVTLDPDADMYYACLASLHKARLKYEGILKTQPIPTLEQVGPRGLLQFGKLTPRALVGFLFWRKWFFDIDNRAGQETGYLFEPVIANAIGGTPIPAQKSPVKRHGDPKKGRQIDCLMEEKAYELKIRLTIAASGQGRWREELDYPIDCRQSGYTPVLVVLDSTPNTKIVELVRAFESQQGEVYIGDKAWQHLDSLAGPTMATFLNKYVRGPINGLIENAPEQLPDLAAKLCGQNLIIEVGNEILKISRRVNGLDEEARDYIPEDIDEEIPG